VGFSTLAAGKSNEFRLKKGVLTSIHYPGSTSTGATSINDNRVIVGGGEDSFFQLEPPLEARADSPVHYSGTFQALWVSQVIANK
jgi:hypothetical protein